MLVVEVDHVHAEPPQRVVAGPAYVVGGAVDPHARSVGTPLVAELGRHHDVLPAIRDRPADERLVDEGAVHVGRVQHRHAEVQCPVDGADRLGVVGGAVELAHPHATQPDGRDRELGVGTGPQSACTHRALPAFSQVTSSDRAHPGETILGMSATQRAGGQNSSEARLLVVDDEPNILELLATSLRFAGFEVTTATNGREALAEARRGRPDLVVLDVMMPDMDGFAVVRRMRAEGSTAPVVFLTARDGTEDKVTGLTVGGDDYVTKPFSLEEIVARIRAVLRRTSATGTAVGGSGYPSRLVFADVELDDDTHEVWKAGALVALSPTEFKLLRYFMQNNGRVLSKAQILDHVWHYDFGGEANVVESYVSYLRRKVDTTEPRLLQTLRGVGYVLRVPRE